MTTEEIFAQHNAHVYAFWNAPLSQRAAWARCQIAEMKTELASSNNRSPDAYYQIKDHIRHLEAGIRGLSPAQHDPMGHWFGMMSN